MKKLLLAVLLLGFAALFTAPSTQASPILSQDILFVEMDGTFAKIGSVSVNVADSFEFAAPTYESFEFLSFDLFGFEFIQSFDDLFYAWFDIDNLMAGFEFLTFELRDQSGELAFDGLFDSGFGDGFGSIFTTDERAIGAFDFILGDVSVTVPAPATLSLMLLALFGLMLRRRA